EDGIRDSSVTGVQTCALPICARPGDNRHSDSVVALRIETGALVWSFQTTHHDVWDYDLPAQPTLARLETGQGARDVVMQPTKQRSEERRVGKEWRGVS